MFGEPPKEEERQAAQCPWPEAVSTHALQVIQGSPTNCLRDSQPFLGLELPCGLECKQHHQRETRQCPYPCLISNSGKTDSQIKHRKDKVAQSD